MVTQIDKDRQTGGQRQIVTQIARQRQTDRRTETKR